MFFFVVVFSIFALTATKIRLNELFDLWTLLNQCVLNYKVCYLVSVLAVA